LETTIVTVYWKYYPFILDSKFYSTDFLYFMLYIYYIYFIKLLFVYHWVIHFYM
jgi:hypothetical protein